MTYIEQYKKLTKEIDQLTQEIRSHIYETFDCPMGLIMCRDNARMEREAIFSEIAGK